MIIYLFIANLELAHLQIMREIYDENNCNRAVLRDRSDPREKVVYHDDLMCTQLLDLHNLCHLLATGAR